MFYFIYLVFPEIELQYGYKNIWYNNGLKTYGPKYYGINIIYKLNLSLFSINENKFSKQSFLRIY